MNGHRVTVRYNDTCHFYQPPRAHHCSVNDNCIERFDHHCPWVGTTIGKVSRRIMYLVRRCCRGFCGWDDGWDVLTVIRLGRSCGLASVQPQRSA